MIQFYIGMLTYRLSLDACFRFIIQPVWSNSYASFPAYPFIDKIQLFNYLFSWCVFLFFLVFFSYARKKHQKKHHASSNLIFLFFGTSFVPLTTLLGLGDVSVSFTLYTLIFWMFFILFYSLLGQIKSKTPQLSKQTACYLYYGIILLHVAITLYVSFRYAGFRISFDLINVYALRSSLADSKMSTGLSYLFSNARAVIPVALAIKFVLKKWRWVAFLVIIQLLSFGVDGLKSVFAILCLTILTAFFYREKYQKYIAIVFAAITSAGLLEYVLFHSYYIVSFIVRRVFILPNVLNYQYFIFFTHNTPDFFQQSFLRHLGFLSQYPHIPRLIGSVFWGLPEMNANSGLVSDAITNTGWLGCIIYPLILALFCYFLDIVSKGFDGRITLIPCIYIAWTFISTFFFTVLITHGVAIMLLLLYFAQNASFSIAKHNA